MATHMGNSGTVKIGASWAGGTVIGELKKWEMTEDQVQIDDSALNDAWDTNAGGSKSASGTIVAHFDPADTAQASLTVGAEVTLYLSGMEGDSADKYFTCAARISSRGVSVDRNQPNERTYSWVANGAVTEGTI